MKVRKSDKSFYKCRLNKTWYFNCVKSSIIIDNIGFGSYKLQNLKTLFI